MKDREITRTLFNPRVGASLMVIPEHFDHVTVEHASFAQSRYTFWHHGTWVGWLLAKARFALQVVRELRK